jgi:nitrite reductase/ring-hydroxylating ferredoxin subunit
MKRFFAVIILSFIFSCKKSNVVEKIPVVPVNLTIYLNLPSYAALNSIGNYVKISGGYKGIIVYRRSQTDFAAFDLACPYDPTASGAILVVDSSGVAAVDYHCGSRFNLAYGSVINGPSTSPMKAYTADYDGNNTVYIYN